MESILHKPTTHHRFSLTHICDGLLHISRVLRGDSLYIEAHWQPQPPATAEIFSQSSFTGASVPLLPPQQPFRTFRSTTLLLLSGSSFLLECKQRSPRDYVRQLSIPYSAICSPLYNCLESARP